MVATFSDAADFRKQFKEHLAHKVREIAELGNLTDESGVVRTQKMWAGATPDSFIARQLRLTLLFKDGFSFFENENSVASLKARLADPAKRTTLLLLHPDYEGIASVAAMDPQKKGRPQLQREQCKDAIHTMHGIRDEISAERGLDVSLANVFCGYRRVPTWTGMLGDSSSFISLYTTTTHRGDLLTLQIMNVLPSGEQSLWYSRYATDAEDLIRWTKDEGNGWNLWEYRP